MKNGQRLQALDTDEGLDNSINRYMPQLPTTKDVKDDGRRTGSSYIPRVTGTYKVLKAICLGFQSPQIQWTIPSVMSL